MNDSKKNEREDDDTIGVMHAATLMPALPITIRTFQPSDVNAICSWVTTRAALATISSDDANYLTPEILLRWCTGCTDAIVLQRLGEPVAFCTISTEECDLPRRYVEIGHIITHPEHRRKYFGATLLFSVRLISALRSYTTLVGRIRPDNFAALSLATYAHWRALPHHPQFDNTFRWFAYELRR